MRGEWKLQNNQYHLDFNKLCKTAKIGKLCGEPTQIKGGLLHRMYRVETSSGKYAVKALNPQIMLRKKAMSDIVNGERIAAVAAQYIRTPSVKCVDGETVLKIDDQYYMVYEWVEGKPLYNESITAWHCEQIGAALGKLHTIDFSPLHLPAPADFVQEPIDWGNYLAKGKQDGLPWAEELFLCKERLSEWNRRYLAAMKYLENHLVIGHRDIDPKNVLWRDDCPIIIDWESAGYINPSQEFIVHALYWSETNEGIDKEKFTAFAKGYASSRRFDKVDWRAAIDTGLCTDWLTYNLNRSLGIESADDAERQLGTEQVFTALNYLKHYEASIAQIVEWMSQIGRNCDDHS